jgi:UPF0716 family protein affecting phage T7 exclusion
MDVALCIGIFILGAAMGALLTRIAITGHLRRLRDQMDVHESDRTAA